jgi:hypothetical protein
MLSNYKMVSLESKVMLRYLKITELVGPVLPSHEINTVRLGKDFHLENIFLDVQIATRSVPSLIQYTDECGRHLQVDKTADIVTRNTFFDLLIRHARPLIFEGNQDVCLAAFTFVYIRNSNLANWGMLTDHKLMDFIWALINHVKEAGEFRRQEMDSVYLALSDLCESNTNVFALLKAADMVTRFVLNHAQSLFPSKIHLIDLELIEKFLGDILLKSMAYEK